jgi:hypothetical protein
MGLKAIREYKEEKEQKVGLNIIVFLSNMSVKKVQMLFKVLKQDKVVKAL